MIEASGLTGFPVKLSPPRKARGQGLADCWAWLFVHRAARGLDRKPLSSRVLEFWGIICGGLLMVGGCQSSESNVV